MLGLIYNEQRYDTFKATVFCSKSDNGATRTSHSHIRDPKSVGIATTLMLLRAMGFYIGVRLIIRLTELLPLICSVIYMPVSLNFPMTREWMAEFLWQSTIGSCTCESCGCYKFS